MLGRLTSVVPRLQAVAVLGALSWSCWGTAGAESAQIDPNRRELGEVAIGRIVEDLRQAKTGAGPVALLHFENDPTSFFTEQLQAAIKRGDVLPVGERPWLERTRDWLGMSRPDCGTRSEALQRGRDEDVAAVLFGRIYSFQSSPLAAELDVEVELARTSDGQVLFSKRYRLDSGGESGEEGADSRSAAPAARGSWLWPSAACLGLVLLLPVASIGLLRRAARQYSNRVNALVLAAYTGVDVLAALVCWGIPGSLGGLLLFLAAAGGACAYNLRMMAYAMHLES